MIIKNIMHIYRGVARKHKNKPNKQKIREIPKGKFWSIIYSGLANSYILCFNVNKMH